jgi:hypothetical protein
MTETDSPRQPGIHRRQRGRRLGRLGLSLLLAVLVGAVVFAVLKWRGELSRHTSPRAAATSPIATSPPVSPPASVSSTLTSASPPPASSPAPTPAPSATAAPAPVLAPKVPLDVLNNSHIPGLAASARRTFIAGGWTVAKTGNYAHTVTSTTVFYPAGKRASALRLASQFPKIRHVAPAPSGLSTTHLTVVLARDWV